MNTKITTIRFIFFNLAHKRKVSVVPGTWIKRWTYVKKYTKLIEVSPMQQRHKMNVILTAQHPGRHVNILYMFNIAHVSTWVKVFREINDFLCQNRLLILNWLIAN